MSQTIDSRQILAFCTLVQTGSFTETARQLNLTQSAISHSVKNLEEDLECQLVTRAGRKIHITEDGEEFYRNAQAILHQMESARDRIRERVNWGRGRLRVGASTTACQHLLPKVLREFGESFPYCAISIFPADTPKLIELVRRYEIDVAIVIDTGKMTDISMLPLFSDELVLVTSPIHPFVKKGSVQMDQIAQQRLVLYNQSSHTFRLIENFFRRNNLALRNYIELGSMEAIKELIKINYGISFLAGWIVENEINRRSLIRIDLGRRKLKRQWGICYASDRKLSITEETFIGLCESIAGTVRKPVKKGR